MASVKKERFANQILQRFRYEDWEEDGHCDGYPRVGDYGWILRDFTTGGQGQVPFEIMLDEDTGLPVLLLKTGNDVRPEDVMGDADDGDYMSLLQVQLEGWEFTYTGTRKTDARKED